MIYTNVPKHLDFNLDIEIIKEELDYFYKNLPEKETNKLQQFNNTKFCKMYWIQIYSAQPSDILYNLMVNGPEINYKLFTNPIQCAIDQTLYKHKDYKFFPKLNERVKSIEEINNLNVLYFKPESTITKHIHTESEHNIQFLLNDMEPGNITIFVDKDEAVLSKPGQQILHDSELPHGGYVAKSECYIFNVSLDKSKFNLPN